MIAANARRRGGVLVALFATLALGFGVVDAPVAAAGKGYRADLFRMLNRARERHDLKALTLDLSLSRDAKKHTRQMIRRDRVYHPPDLRSILAPYPWNDVGAAAVGCAATLRKLHRAWMRSEQHREILLHPEVRSVGIGVLRNDEKNACGRRSFWGTGLFYG